MPRRRTKNQNLQGICRNAEKIKVKNDMQYGTFERRINKDSIEDRLATHGFIQNIVRITEIPMFHEVGGTYYFKKQRSKSLFHKKSVFYNMFSKK